MRTADLIERSRRGNDRRWRCRDPQRWRWQRWQ